jgi:hypothetical protein
MNLLEALEDHQVLEALEDHQDLGNAFCHLYPKKWITKHEIVIYIRSRLCCGFHVCQPCTPYHRYRLLPDNTRLVCHILQRISGCLTKRVARIHACACFGVRFEWELCTCADSRHFIWSSNLKSSPISKNLMCCYL